MLAALDADVFVLATGAVPAPAAFADDGSVRVLTSADVLRGERPDGDGTVLVVGGTEPHLDPLLTARLLAADGRAVRLVSELVAVAPTVEQRTLNHLLSVLAALDVEIATSTRLDAVAGGQARTTQLLADRGACAAVGAIVLAHTRRPDPFAARLSASPQDGRPTFVVGDALAPRRLTHAVLEGARFGTSF
jgi:2,4-dienoyl-CoA reductase (NADPH2)